MPMRQDLQYRRVAHCALLVLSGLMSHTQVFASGTFVVSSQSEWRAGTWIGIDSTFTPGSLLVLRNVSQEFSHSGSANDPMGFPWKTFYGNGYYDRTARSGYLRMLS